MKFVNPLPFVADMARAKAFYTDVLGLRVVEDHGDFVQFEHGFALHEGRSLHRTIFGEEAPDTSPYGRRNLVLYFEVEDLDAAFAQVAGRVAARLAARVVDDGVALIHPIERQSWGQRVFRCTDPDGHIIEVGTPL